MSHIGNRRNPTENQSELDYYATEPKATEILLQYEKFSNPIWEPACGELHIAEVLRNNGYQVYTSDIVQRSKPIELIADFLEYDSTWKGDIITNPPYKKAKEFCEKALEVIPEGNKVAMFLKLTFLESKGRKQFFLDNPPKTVYVSSSRLYCAKNGDFSTRISSAVAYAWFVWEKGFCGDTVLKWVN